MEIGILTDFGDSVGYVPACDMTTMGMRSRIHTARKSVTLPRQALIISFKISNDGKQHPPWASTVVTSPHKLVFLVQGSHRLNKKRTARANDTTWINKF